MGGQKVLQTTNNKRTPQTIIRPRQDSQNPRANNNWSTSSDKTILSFAIKKRNR